MITKLGQQKFISKIDELKEELRLTYQQRAQATIELYFCQQKSPLGIAIVGKSKFDKVLVNDNQVTIVNIQVGDI